MEFIKVIAVLLTITVLQCNAACDVQTLISECSAHVASLSNLPEEPTPDDIKNACGHVAMFEECLTKYEPTCSGDQTYQGLVQSKGSYTQMCGGGAMGGACAALQCTSVISSSDSGAGSQTAPEPEPEPGMGMEQIKQMCMKYASFKSCLAANDVSKCAPQYVDAINQIKSNFTAMCEGECAVTNMFDCLKNVDMKELQGLKGFPTSTQLTAVCKDADSLITCVGNYIRKCPIKTKDDMARNMNMYKNMLNTICKESKQTIVKYTACFENETVQALSKACTKTPVVTSDGQPADETKEEMCGRIEAEAMCMGKIVEKHCSQEDVEAFDNLYIKIMSATSGTELDCGTGGAATVQFSVWMSLLMAGLLMMVFY